MTTLSEALHIAATLVRDLDVTGTVSVHPGWSDDDAVYPPTIHVVCMGIDEVVCLADRLGSQVVARDVAASNGYPDAIHHVTNGRWCDLRVSGAWIEQRAAVTA